MSAGVKPNTIVAALTTKTEDCNACAAKYSPDQPRVPAGNTDGGQWTREDRSDQASTLLEGPKRRQPAAAQLGLVLPDGCEEEWAKARAICIDLLSAPNAPRGLTGGHKTVDGCAKGFVSQRCGGNPVA